MKRTLSIMVMALSLLLTQCRKPEVKTPSPASPEGTTVSMTVTAGPGSKTDITTAGGIVWSAGDKLYVGHNNAYVGYLTIVSGVGTPTGTFSGDVTLPNGTTDEQTFGFFYLGNAARTLAVGATSAVVDFSSQEIYAEDGKLKNAGAQHVGYGTAKGTVANGIVTGINVTLVSKVALGRFSFTESDSKGGAYTGALTLSGTGIYNKMTVGFGGNFTGNTKGNISLRGSHSERYVMLVPTNSTAAKTLNFGGGASGTATLEKGIEANKFYGRESAIVVKVEPNETVNFGTPNLNWSVCNLGASNGTTKESWYGDYYAWGATETWYSAGGQTTSTTWKDDYSNGYSWAHCPFTNGTFSLSNTKVFTKYVPTEKSEYWAGDEDHPDNKLVLESSDDAATANWGSGWRMPTSAEWKSLYDNNTFEWLGAGSTSAKVTSFKAVAAGYLVVKGKGESIDLNVYMFLPAAGSRSGKSISAGSYGYYWSSSLYSSDPYNAYILYFSSTTVSQQSYVNRCSGFPVRPVRPAR